jgi:hypothetical protein
LRYAEPCNKAHSQERHASSWLLQVAIQKHQSFITALHFKRAKNVKVSKVLEQYW